LAHRTGGSGSSSWPTADANTSTYSNGERGENLREAAEHWATPTSHERTLTPRDVDHGEQLANQADKWQTPTGSMVESRKQVGAEEREDLLPRQAAKWVTPQAHDAASGPSSAGRIGRHGTRHGGRDLVDQSQTWPTPRCGAHGTPGAGLRHPTIETSGPESSPSAPTSRRRLNPLFVEWLMGFPEGWTDCEPLGTESFLRWRQQHSDNY
jgi:hypothetical protein